MRKWFIWFAFLIALGFAGALVFSGNKAPIMRNIDEQIARIPKVELLQIDNQTAINTANAKRGKAIVFFYFDPNCEHCKHETEDIVANQAILKNVQFYFISLDTLQSIRKFVDDYKLRAYPTITVAKDYQYEALKAFKPKSIPSTFVYDEKHKIVAVFEGRMRVEDLKKALDI